MTKKEIELLLFSDVFESYAASNNANEFTNYTRRKRFIRYAPDIYYVPIKSVTKAQLIEWRIRLNKTNLKTRTKNAIITTLKGVFLHASELYDIDNPSVILKQFPKTIEDYNEQSIINYSQLKQALLYEPDKELALFYEFLFMTGVRRGEARALLSKDFDGSTVHIYKSMRRGEESLKTTKNRQARKVPLDDATAAKIAALANKNKKYLFGDSRPLDLNKIGTHWRTCLQKAKLPHIRIHDLRHSHVSMLWDAGIPVPEISKRVGHNSPKTTMEMYAHIFDSDQSKTLNFLNALTVQDLGSKDG